MLLQLVTIVWMCAEATIAVFAALRAHSLALLGFGADSGIELVSAFVVFLQFRKVSQINEKRAARITGVLLFSLAAFIVGSSILAFTNPLFKPQPSYLGIVLLIAAAVVMPWLSTQIEHSREDGPQQKYFLLSSDFSPDFPSLYIRVRQNICGSAVIEWTCGVSFLELDR